MVAPLLLVLTRRHAVSTGLGKPARGDQTRRKRHNDDVNCCHPETSGCTICESERSQIDVSLMATLPAVVFGRYRWPMTRQPGVVADDPRTAASRCTHFGRKLVVLALGGMLVGLAITVVVDREQLAGGHSWTNTTLLLLAVIVAAGVGSLITRGVTVTGQVTQRAAARLEQASHTLDGARREARSTPADTGVPAVQAEVDAVARNLDGVNRELAALRRSGNRTAWATFFLGALVGLITQITLG